MTAERKNSKTYRETQPQLQAPSVSDNFSKRPAIRSDFDSLADCAFIREAQLVQKPNRPGNSPPVPFSAPTLWRNVKNGTFPQPYKLSERVTAWRVGDIRAWLAARAAGGVAK